MRILSFLHSLSNRKTKEKMVNIMSCGYEDNEEINPAVTSRTRKRKSLVTAGKTWSLSVIRPQELITGSRTRSQGLDIFCIYRNLVSSKKRGFRKLVRVSCMHLLAARNRPEDGERILKVTKKSGNRGRCRKLCL